MTVFDEPDYYAVLQVTATATTAEVRAAYRRLARELHPDVNDETDAASVFRDVVAAHAVLTDAQLRSQYDRRRSVAQGTTKEPEAPADDRTAEESVRRTSAVLTILEEHARYGARVEVVVRWAGAGADKTVEVEIPAGAVSGDTIVIDGVEVVLVVDADTHLPPDIEAHLSNLRRVATDRTLTLAVWAALLIGGLHTFWRMLTSFAAASPTHGSGGSRMPELSVEDGIASLVVGFAVPVVIVAGTAMFRRRSRRWRLFVAALLIGVYHLTWWTTLR